MFRFNPIAIVEIFFFTLSKLKQGNHLPLPTKPRQSPFPAQQFLHGPLLNLLLLGDQGIQGGDEGVYVREGCGYGVLFGERWEWNLYISDLP